MANNRIEELKNRLSEVTESDQMVIIRALFDEIRKSSGSIVNKLGEGVAISNFDEVKATFTNELRANSKELSKILGQLKISGEKQTKIIAQINKENLSSLESEFQSFRIRVPRESVAINNFDQMMFPKDFSINNLEGIIKGLEELRKAFNIEIPTPQVTVQPTPVHIPEQKIEIPAVDLSPIAESIKALQKSIKTSFDASNSRAFSKLLDGLSNKLDKMTNGIQLLGEAQGKAFAAFPGPLTLAAGSRIRLKPSKSITSGRKTVTNGGTRVQVTTVSVPIDYVLVSGDGENTDMVVVGDKNVVAALDSQQGVVLIDPVPQRLDISNLKDLWVDSIVNGDSLCFAYFSS